ncbi:uncharacterized protein LOC127052569 [Gopherus flavomarginatus]|uniref:uncharacterized protein LOC127052569 n=1 Tax=Gopherus flavomarginatus TaxID=286002 RepID=UPI0021CBAAFF|nr:uncharacterized protein LOC127052569 [Gopherus flavomarginatus]
MLVFRTAPRGAEQVSVLRILGLSFLGEMLLIQKRIRHLYGQYHPNFAGIPNVEEPLSISWLLPPTLLAGHCAAPFPAYLGAGDRGREHLPSSSIPAMAAGIILSPPLPGAETPSAEQEWAEEEEEEEKEEEGVSPEQDTIRVIQEHLWGRAELVAKQLRFLHTLPCLCFSAQQQGLNTLKPHFSKVALVESIAELIENLPVVPEPTFIISSFMAAVCSLSKLKQLLALELESHLLRALLYTIFTIGTGKDTTHFQALHNIYLQSLDAMVGCLLTETPPPARKAAARLGVSC